MPHLWADCVLCKCFCKRQRTWKKMNPLCPCQVGEKGASFGSLLMHTWVLHWRGLHVALFNNTMQPPPCISHYMVCQNILVKGKGEQQLGELMQSKKFLLDKSGDVFYLNDLTFIRKSQEECESFPFFFLKAHAVVLWWWIAGFVGGGGAELPFWGDPALVFSSAPSLINTERWFWWLKTGTSKLVVGQKYLVAARLCGSLVM